MPDEPLVEYFRTLDAGDVDRCAAAFAEDASYTRPGASDAPEGGTRGERTLLTIRGRSAIREYLGEMRRLAADAGMPPGWGPHEVTACAREGNCSFAFGYVPTGPAGGVSAFLAYAEHDGEDRITSYVALAMRDPERDDT